MIFYVFIKISIATENNDWPPNESWKLTSNEFGSIINSFTSKNIDETVKKKFLGDKLEEAIQSDEVIQIASRSSSPFLEFSCLTTNFYFQNNFSMARGNRLWVGKNTGDTAEGGDCIANYLETCKNPINCCKISAAASDVKVDCRLVGVD
ncbi:hypothetical protein RF11_09839 [Thelohanellus kitauei]|uniref:Uncharacterized protein n=1 Tax=Thelohanellus kitauei TaxID=669202 RepID=A0A0C2IH71_THEKT|nr:hypothetical protein RF11_09839 [Thelohanellus kitauei]